MGLKLAKNARVRVLRLEQSLVALNYTIYCIRIGFSSFYVPFPIHFSIFPIHFPFYATFPCDF